MSDTPSSARRQLLRCGSGALAAFTLAPAVAWSLDDGRTALTDALVKQTALPRSQVAAAIAQARFHDSIIKRITTPYESRPYSSYRPLFVQPKLVAQGAAYMAQHQAIFAEAEQRYHLQPEVITAILGMETHYGRHRGSDRVLDSLFTLATGFPRRAAFFRRELGEFLLMCQEEGRDVTKVLGSYAGAFGTTQFIPSSYRAYAVDGDGDGRRDVWDSPKDIIFSVGNYFHSYHWDDTRPVAHWLSQSLLQHEAIKGSAAGAKLRWQPLAALRSVVGELPLIWRDDDRVALITLQESAGRRPLLIHHNFYVITRWNRSHNYAMAATELAAALGSRLCAV
ncbi:MAG: lytic murein transglycosylase B [Mariprofundales bacterium]|nr:lytic murein transglycosylase B [Mariprofundales bacterium]